MAKANATPILALRLSNVREYVAGDAAAIAKQCNNHNISQWMTNGFPNPYTLQDAHDWINHNLAIAAKSPSQNFLIVDPKTDSAIGGIGIKPGTDVYTHTAEIGYWLGEEYWGRGIVSEALPAFTQWLWEKRDIRRLWAGVFDSNAASRRLLEKTGYLYEGTMKGHVEKEGVIRDSHIYGLTRAETFLKEPSPTGGLLWKQCKECKAKKVVYSQAQTRSAHEPMTTYCECQNCGSRWQFS